MRITPLLPHLGARVEGVDLSGPVDEPTFQRIKDAFEEHSVLVFHDQHPHNASVILHPNLNGT